MDIFHPVCPVCLIETFIKKRGVAILLRHDLAYTEIDDIQLTKTTNEQLTVAIITESNREQLDVSTVVHTHGVLNTWMCGGGGSHMEYIIPGWWGGGHTWST